MNKRIFLLLLVLLLTFALVACGGDKNQDTPPRDDTGSNETPPADNTGSDETPTVDRTNPSSGKYQIKFYLGNTPISVTHYYNKGETITPPTDLPAYNTTRENFYFDGWEGVNFKTVEKNTSYRSKTRSEYNYYTATFVIGEEKVEVKTICGDFPKAPAITEFSIADGEKFVLWEMPTTAPQSDETICGITTKYFDPQYFVETYKYPLLTYSSKLDEQDSESDVLGEATALACLLYEEHQNPKGEAIARRIVAHLASVVTKEQAPAFDACCYWSYAVLTGAIALAKETPTVWELVPTDIKLRLDVMMRAFAIIGSFATSDYNNFETGPGMLGNYKKTWNPNFRMAMIPIIVYATHYFGNGDMTEGANTVNAFLKGFNEKEYNDILGIFQKYGWRRAKLTWSTEGRTATDGSGMVGASAKELMLYGGQAVGEDTNKVSDLLVPLGSGLGVTNGGNDYLYLGNTLAQGENIIRALLRCNYGTDSGYFKEVTSMHLYDTNGDGVKEVVAWILDDKISPYEGRYGMMREFGQGDRSSANYCTVDFILANTMITTSSLLGIYDLYSDTYADGSGNTIREAVYVGNEDYLFKAENGYSSYATGSYGGYVKVYTNKDEHPGTYFAVYSFWRANMLPQLEPFAKAD